MTAHSPSISSTPSAWAETLGTAPVLEARIGGMVPLAVRRWKGLSSAIEQAALDQHFVSVHLGGAKKLSRRGGGVGRSRSVRSGAYSIVPAGSAFRWDTEGPVDFMHIYFDPTVVAHVVGEAFDRDPASLSLHDALGESDALIHSLVQSLHDELAGADRQQAYLDDIAHLLLCRMLRVHSNVGLSPVPARHALAPFRVRRAKDYVEANLANAIGVAEIARAAGISQYHFSRAFRQTTGRAPYSYLLERRISAAKAMLAAAPDTLTSIAQACGFTSLSQFSRMFKREVGLSPSRYRAHH